MKGQRGTEIEEEDENRQGTVGRGSSLNPESRAALGEFVKSSLVLLHMRFTSGEQVPISTVRRIGRDNSGTLGLYEGIDSDLVQFAVKHQDEILALPQYREALESLSRNDLVRKQAERKTYDSQGNLIPNADIRSLVGSSYVLRFLYNFIEERHSLEFSQQDFDQLYQGMEEFLRAVEYRYVVLAPIHGFKCEVDRVSLAEDLEIRRLTLGELDRILKADTLGQVPITDFLQFEFAVASTVRVIRGESLIIDRVRARIDLVISALRIWKSGALGVSVYYLIPTNIWQRGVTSAFTLAAPRFLVGLPHALSGSDTVEFPKFFVSLDKCLVQAKSKEMTFLDIALKRFNASMEAIEFEDRVMDIMISLEAMLLSDEEVGELPYRLSLRASVLLGDNEDETRYAQRFLKKVYEKLRNKIFHGRKVKELIIDNKSVSGNQVLAKLEEYTRTLVMAFVGLAEHYESHEAILQAIDEAVVSTKARTTVKQASIPTFVSR